VRPDECALLNDHSINDVNGLGIDTRIGESIDHPPKNAAHAAFLLTQLRSLKCSIQRPRDNLWHALTRP
jgi:hypothetical protein